MNILLVDDSAVIRKMLRKVLTECALPLGNVFEAGDGSQALKILDAESVQLILCDVNMPVMSGYEFLERVRGTEQFANIPILMVTTEGSAESVGKALQLGANGYIRKPFTPDEVKEKIVKSIQRAA